MKRTFCKMPYRVEHLICVFICVSSIYGFRRFSPLRLAPPYISLQTVKPLSTSRSLTFDHSILQSLGVFLPPKRSGKVPLFKLPFRKTLTALQKLALLFKQFFEWLQSLHSRSKPVRKSQNLRSVTVPSSSSSTATILNERKRALNRLDQALRGVPANPIVERVRRNIPSVQPLFEKDDDASNDDYEEVMLPSLTDDYNMTHIEANVSRLYMSKEQQARLYVEERLREIEMMRENRRFALYGELPPPRTSDNKQKLSQSSSSKVGASKPPGEYNPPPSMQFSAQRTMNKRSYWPPHKNNISSVAMMNPNATHSSKSQLNQYGHYVNEPSSASLTIDNATPMLSALPPLHPHHNSENNSSTMIQNVSTTNTVSSNDAALNVIQNTNSTTKNETPAVSTSTSLARISPNGSSGDVIADLFASIVVTNDDKVHYPRFVGRWRLLEQRFVNASNIDTTFINKNIKPAAVTILDSDIIPAVPVVAAGNATEALTDVVVQVKPSAAPPKLVVEPLLSAIQEDLITIPSYGPVFPSLNGSSGTDIWKCYSVTDEKNASRVLLSFDILRGCSTPIWTIVAGEARMAGVERPPKGTFDQLPKPLLYRGEILGNRVLGHVYIGGNKKEDPQQPIGMFQLLRIDGDYE